MTIAVLEEFPIVIDMPVAWGQMDAFNHVNNVVYFRFFEDARIAYFEQIQYLQEIEKTGIGPILAHTECKYKFPVTFPDQLKLAARVKEMGDNELSMHYLVWSEKAGRVAAEGTGKIVSFDYRNNCRADIPDAVRARINKLECRSC
jgi:acyl-CoA thioester hydrolase